MHASYSIYSFGLLGLAHASGILSESQVAPAATSPAGMEQVSAYDKVLRHKDTQMKATAIPKVGNSQTVTIQDHGKMNNAVNNLQGEQSAEEVVLSRDAVSRTHKEHGKGRHSHEKSGKYGENDTMEGLSGLTSDHETESQVHRPKLSRCLAVSAMIVVSEVGDKTFFISALMAMRSSPWLVFSASIAPLAIMHTLSTFLGLVLPSILSPKKTLLLATVLFLVFGLKMMVEALKMKVGDLSNEEMEEVEQEIEIQDSNRIMEKAEKQSSESSVSGYRFRFSSLVSPMWIQIFVMIFLAEWGDRSQIATIALGASTHIRDVLLGGIVGHAICSTLAVVGGSLLATKLSPRTITFCGATCFLAFSVLYFLDWKKEC